MESSRRDLLRKIGAGISTAVVIGVAGCTSIRDGSDSNDNGAFEDESDQVGSVSLPIPELKDTQIPNVELQGIQSDSVNGDNDGEMEYVISLQNNGGTGDIIVHLYWTENEESDPENVSYDDLTFAARNELEINEGEETTTTFTETVPEEYEGTWAIVSPASVTAIVANTGEESGDIDVTLLENGEPQGEETVYVEAGDQTEVEFEREYTFEDVSFDIRVDVSEQ